MRIFCIVILSLLSVAVVQAQPRDRFDEATSAYSNAEYKQAIQLLHDLENEGYASFPVYYNLGNAYYKNGNLGAAMLYFEKALLQEPGNADVLHNIRVVRARTRDRVEPIPLLFFVRWWNDVQNAYLPATFFSWSVAFLWLLAASLFLFFGFRRVLLRRIALVASIATGVFFILTVVLYSTRLEQISAHSNAIIMPDETTVLSTPDATGVESFVVHEGLKVQILEVREEMYHIRLADGKNGWIPRSAAERI